MATVYRARDRKHDRDVAIKVLHPDLGAALGADRFLAEIRTTARLQHPHILPLLDSGVAEGVLYYVMPLVTGETLRARLERERQLPIADALRITREVASALEHAHRQGVIHRDIKPENILLQDGQALVADFGIALAVAGTDGERLTRTGLSLGTPQYMSPEQAMGERTMDARSDVYALGAVCYEMLAGEPPYTGNSLQAIVARVLSERPTSLRTLRETVPPHVEAAVFTALARLPADRFASARAFADALGDDTHTSGAAVTGRATGGRTAWKGAAAACAAVAALAIGAAAWLYARDARAPRDIGLPPDAAIRMADIYRNFAVAHDGSFIVYEARIGESSQLWYRSLVRDELRAIPGTDGAYGTPRISPDDARVAFAADGELRAVSVAGGAVTTLAAVGDPSGGAWLDDGTILLADDDGSVLRRVSVDGGPGRAIRVKYCILPSLVPDSRTVLCGGGAEKFAGTRGRDGADTTRWVLRATAAGASGARLKGSDFRVVDARYLVYIGIDGTLMATRIEDPATFAVGTSVALVPAVRRSQYSGAGQFDIAANGTLVYAPGINAEVGRLVRWSSAGTIVPLLPAAAAYLRFEPSRDGRRLATVVETAIEQELHVHDLATGREEIVDKGAYLGSMAWSPDGATLAYWRRGPGGDDREALVTLRVDSAAPPRTLFEAPPGRVLEVSAYLAADSLLVGSIGGPTLLVDPTVSPVRVDSLPISSLFVSVSPDRRWIAYVPIEQRGVVVQPFPSFGRRYQASATGQEPRWRSPDDVVFWMASAGGQATTSSIRHVAVGGRGDAPVSAPSLLVADPRFSDTPGWSQAIMPGGDIVYMQGPAETIGSYVRVVPGWVAAMKRAVDAANR